MNFPMAGFEAFKDRLWVKQEGGKIKCFKKPRRNYKLTDTVSNILYVILPDDDNYYNITTDGTNISIIDCFTSEEFKEGESKRSHGVRYYPISDLLYPIRMRFKDLNYLKCFDRVKLTRILVTGEEDKKICTGHCENLDISLVFYGITKRKVDEYED